MSDHRDVHHISVSIERSPDEVYQYAKNPANLPRWAAGLASGIERSGDDWVADSPMGRVTVRFVPDNPYRVLDHEVRLPTGVSVTNPLRVIANGSRSEVTFTLFRQPGMTDDAFEADAQAVARDLATLKLLLEERGG